MKTSLRFVPLLVLAVASVVLLNRCGLEQAAAPSGTFRSVFEAIQVNNCAECHTATGTAFVEDGVELEFGNAASAFSGLTTKTVTGNISDGICGGVPLVTANDLSKSYFAAVLFEDVATDDFAGQTGCTPYSTHHTDTNLSSLHQESIKAWINNGAPND